jgi:coenzyme F420-reducing hydrogenase delta subunit/NAD-dependent dihydropyrimidine dehydrogenase PreA subunit
MVGTLLALLVLSLIKPAVSHPEADLSIVPGDLSLDWFYLQVYPLADEWDPAWVWGLLFGASMFLSILPWLPPKRDVSLAIVDLENCNGCGRCVDDCPYSAVTMMPRSDGLKFEKEAVVNTDLCTGCGICVGACPTATPHRRKSAMIPGIDLDQLPIRDIREQVIAASGKLSGDDRVLVFGCNTSPRADKLQGEGVGVVKMPCVGMLPPAFMDYVISKGLADGVMVAGCCKNDCHFRMGIEWTEKRIERKRDPYLRKRVPSERISKCWVGDFREEALARQVDIFRASLREYGPMIKNTPADLKQDQTVVGSGE